MIVFLEAQGTNAYNRYAMCPAGQSWKTYRLKRCGNNNKDEDNSSKNLNDKNQQASSQRWCNVYHCRKWRWQPKFKP